VIVVLGATGFVGGYLLEELLKGDEPVRCSVRSTLQRGLVADLGLEPVWADVRDEQSLTGLLAGARVVVNLVTTTRETRSAPFSVIHGEGMRNLVGAARRAGVERVVHVGALGPDSAGEGSRHPYLYWKQQARRLLQDSGLPHVVLETSIVFGPGDQHLTHVALALKWMPFLPLAGGETAMSAEFQPLWVGDLVQALVAATRESVSTGQVLPLGGPRVWRFGEMVAFLQELLGTRRRVVAMPGWLIRLYFGSGRLSPVSTSMLELLRDGIPSVADSADSYRQLGLLPQGLEERGDYLRQVGMRDLMAWRRGTPIHGAFSRLPARPR
jgi:uncharacterized protein YbjT (DUF2867 family)